MRRAATARRSSGACERRPRCLETRGTRFGQARVPPRRTRGRSLRTEAPARAPYTSGIRADRVKARGRPLGMQCCSWSPSRLRFRLLRQVGTAWVRFNRRSSAAVQESLGYGDNGARTRSGASDADDQRRRRPARVPVVGRARPHGSDPRPPARGTRLRSDVAGLSRAASPANGTVGVRILPRRIRELGPGRAPARHRLHARRRARGGGCGPGRRRHRGRGARRAQRRRVHRDRARRRARGRFGAARSRAGAARAARVLRGRERRRAFAPPATPTGCGGCASGSPATTATRWTRRSSAGTTPGCDRSSGDGRSRGSCRGVTAPVLLIQGDRDAYGTSAQLDAIERGVSVPVTRTWLEDCGHAPHRESPEATLDAIAAFLAANVPRA